jgi:hypothetical protein
VGLGGQFTSYVDSWIKQQEQQEKTKIMARILLKQTIFNFIENVKIGQKRLK